jgi:hypothetical protein
MGNGLRIKGDVMRAHIAYLKYVIRHKWFVFQACLIWGVPLWQAIIHDWTKFTPAEWSPYVHSFYNSDGSKKNPKTQNTTLEVWKLGDAFREAWNSHQKRNPHHWQYWVLINDEDGINPLEMPERYVLEMLADWEGAGRAITGKSDPAGWYARNYDKFIFHPKTRELVEELLNVQA